MKRRRHTPEQVIRKLAEGDKLLAQGKTVEEVARHLEITESTWHRWRNQYGGMKADDAKRLKELEKENTRLKKIVADQALDIDMLKELNRGKLLTPDRRRQAVVALREQFGVTERTGLSARRPAQIHPAPRAPRSRPTTSWHCGPSSATSRDGVPAGAGAGPPRRPGRPAGGSTTSGSTASGAEGLRVPYRKRKRPAPRHRRGRGRLLPDPAQRRVGPRLPVRPDSRREDAQALERHRRVHAAKRSPSTSSARIDADGVVACLDRLAAERGAPRLRRASTTAPSSSPTPSPTGAGSTGPTPSSSTPAHRGRTPGSRASTADSATST